MERGLVSCAICGASDVEKALMAPRVPTKGNAASPEEVRENTMMTPPVDPEIARKLSALRAEIEKSSDYVGDRFAAEARAMHVGETEGRAIHGEATRDEAKSLIEDGVPVAPLPFLPKRND